MAGIPDYGYGDGSDGNVTISSNQNATTYTSGGRSYSNQISYNVSSLSNNSAILTATANGIAAGDKVLLINLQGKSTNYDQVGKWEVLEVDSVGGTTVNFTTDKVNYYGSTVGGDDDLGTTINSTQRVVLQRIPQYNDFTINTGISFNVNGWNGQNQGIICMMVNGDLTVTGSMVATGAGYRGTQGGYGPRRAGENIHTKPVANDDHPHNGNQPGGGAGSSHYGSGAGGGYGTAGMNSWCDQGATVNGGSIYGVNTLATSFFGSSGGDGYSSSDGSYGGGIIMLFARNIEATGEISTNGTDGISTGEGGAGGGAGGSILIWSSTIDNTDLNAFGGQGGAGWGSNPGSDGGVGRIAVYSKSIGTINSVPTHYEEQTMSWKVEGLLSEDAHVAAYNASNDELLTADDFSAGAYSLTGINISSAVNVVAIKTDGQMLAFGNVTPAEDI